MDQPGLRLLIATEKSMENLVVTKDLVFCSGYNEPSFSKSTKKRCTLQTRYPLWSTITLSVL